MSKAKTSKIPGDIARLRQRIERWRRTRRKRSPMPEELWQAAARAAQVHGVWPVARDLGVAYATLKDRATRKPSTKRRKGKSEDTGEFVELSAAQLLGANPKAAVVELQTKDGLRITIRYEDGGQLDVSGLLAAFYGRSQR